MDKLTSLHVFVAVAEAEGFAPAARRLGMSAPAVTRAVAALERHLGARLFQRTTRQVRLTDIGRAYLEDCRTALDQLAAADARASGAREVPQGHLVVTAPVMFGRLHVTPLLLEFLDIHPRLTARALLVDRVVNLVDEGIDVAVRIAHLPDSGLVAVPAGVVRRVLVASPDYLKRHGTPRVPGELAGHVGIGVNSLGGPARNWEMAELRGGPERATRVERSGRAERAGGADRERRRDEAARAEDAGGGARNAGSNGLQVRFTVNANDAALQAARAGHGLVRMLSYQVADDVAAGKLLLLMEDYEPAPIPVHLVHAEGRQASAKVRAFVEFAVARLRGQPGFRPRD